MIRLRIISLIEIELKVGMILHDSSGMCLCPYGCADVSGKLCW